MKNFEIRILHINKIFAKERQKFASSLTVYSFFKTRNNMKSSVRASGVSDSLDFVARKGFTGRSNRVKRAELFV